jgi:hypothetical protein
MSQVARRRQARPKSAQPCAWCRRGYRPARKTSRYCSPGCRIRAFRARGTGRRPPRQRLTQLRTSASAEWYTPPAIIDRVLAVLGHIDLDPCAEPGRSIPAVVHLTAADDGLAQAWHGRVYMNPPYGRSIVHWIRKLRTEYETGQVEAAIALLPARPDTQWWKLTRGYPRCHVEGRLKFSGHKNSATFPSALVYFGPDPERFAQVFGELGEVVIAVASARGEA